jgi:anion-transporting  ArsA/GET3 family ATPase
MARASKRSFVSRIVSKVTEIKNILAEVAALTTEKTNLQSDPVTNAQVITEKTQRIELKTKKIENKVKKSEVKVNAVVVQKIEQKVIASLIAESEEDYNLINIYDDSGFSITNGKAISFISSTKYNFVSKNLSSSGGTYTSVTFIYGQGLGGYFGNKFVIFKGEESANYLSDSSQLSNTSDSRGYYPASFIKDENGNDVSGKFRTNWIKYKRNDIWCLYDAENDIMYYNNYTGNNFIPTKKWYRADILYKTPIELKIQDSGSESGSGSSGGGGSVGISVLDYITEDADKIIWDYAEDRFEPYGNYLLKTTMNRPLISTEIQNIVNFGGDNYFIIFPPSGITEQGENYSVLNPTYLRPQQYSINSSTRIYLARDYNLGGGGTSTIPDFISVAETHNEDDAGIAAIQKYNDQTGFYFYTSNYKSSRNPKKVLNGAYPYYYEIYDDGKIYKIQGNNSSSPLKFANSNTINNNLTGINDNISEFSLYATGAYNMFGDNPNNPVILKQDSKIEIQYTLGGRHQHEIPNSLTKENINNIVLYNNTYPAGAVIYILDNSGNLYCSNTLNNTLNGAAPSWILRDTGVRQITFNSTWSIFAGITNDFNLKKYQNNFGDSDFADYPSGKIITGNKYRLISPKYAVRHFE